jgi:flagellar protein FliJ
MAKGLKTLIRLSEWTVDEKRRELGVILDNLAVAEQARDDLEAELLREQASAQSAPQEAGFFYGAYADGVINKREQLRQQIININFRVEEAREALSEAYREQKKYETVEKNRLEREAKERDRKEQLLLDELGLQNFTQKQRDDLD